MIGRAHVLPTVIALAVLGVTACQKATPPTAESSATDEVRGPALVATEQEAATMDPPDPVLPEPKAYASTPDEVLGTTPNGVGLAVGTPMPAFAAENMVGERIESQTLLAQGPMLIVFYRGGW